MSISRRTLLTGTLAVAAIGSTTVPATAAPPRLTLPRPTGPYEVGTVTLNLVDRSRPDPFTGQAGHRELMAGVWYPARDTGRYPRAPWMEPDLLRTYLVDAGYAADTVLTPLTYGHVGAPVRRTGKGLPVLIFSHGAGGHRNEHSTMVQQLASHGYVVIAIDHLGDAYSRLPDGRIVTPTEQSAVPEDYAQDARFVVGRLARLPHGLAGAVDTSRIGMFGWSKGGTATARVLLTDPRVKAGLAIDGPMLPALSGHIDRPFMLMTAEFPRATDPAVARFWTQLHGWRLDVRAEGAVHSSYGDLQVLMPQLAKVVGMSNDELRGWIGTLDPGRAVRIGQAYPLAFFDEHLRGREQRLLDGPTRRFPEVKYLP
ncbi:hypothetical protein Aab01nite_37600 [Paractinoplanes abujensis]|uniref:Dienelactone hydrolase n=1 Tax=Paractinoplanes abujensis TaxID=882441 RepID=A0A7W7G569_9ACTN|nr:alpha/beta hydrolase [Actinoplanes abujensis]MBB4694616.1 dienelactone hydrolase [Actinoplanes abujensis]GID20170.1 hypothetical protein Aab01nite_37600 [Actinoplanes abujensis]